MTPSHPSAKKRCSLIQRPNETLPTEQRAPRSQTRAGAETICRPAGIEHQSLHRFFLYNSQPGGARKLVVYPLETTVVRGVSN